MSGNFNRNLEIKINVNPSDPRLLEGLENWLRLGLITEGQVRFLCEKHLTCPFAEPIIIRNLPKTPVTTPVRVAPVAPRVKVLLPPPTPGVMTQIWQAFKDELSVRWLLFLGVFLVVASSGVFAATVWQWLPAALQYAILWLYTLTFWGLGFRLGKDEKLRLTSQTLQIIGILLIPVNFWAIDSFNLWNNILGWLTVAVATISLTGISFIQNKEKNLLVANFLGLSYLHWGWQLPGIALLAVYCAMIGSGIVIRFLLPRQQNNQEENQSKSIKIGTGFIVYSLAILLLRAIFVFQIPIGQLGLAVGICGWLFTGESLSKKQFKILNNFQSIGIALLAIGWLVSVDQYPWQAIGISGLALHFCSQRLTKYWLRRDLLAIFLIGLQTLILIREVIPNQFKENALNVSVEIANSQTYPFTVYGLTLFPYIIFMVWLTGWLSAKDKVKLADFGDSLTFCLGIGLTSVCLLNPLWRSLNLLLSTATLIYVIHRRLPVKINFLYFTHILGLVTLASIINWLNPNLSLLSWWLILIAATIIEWLIAILPNQEENDLKKIWYQSCWHLGYTLTVISYFTGFNFVLVGNNYNQWAFIWLIIPFVLITITNLYPQKSDDYEALTVLAGSLLISTGLFDPTWRSLNLLAYSLLLIYTTSSRFSTKNIFIYLTHISGLLTVFSLVDLYLPNLNQLAWTKIILVVMIIEWAVSILPFSENSIIKRKWYQSAWKLGFVFAIISYLLLLDFSLSTSNQLGLLWLITPLTLTGIANFSKIQKRDNIILISTCFLIIAQTLTVTNQNNLLVSLAFATGLMCLNSYYLQNLFTASIHVTFALMLGVVFFSDKLTNSQWFLFGLITVTILWLSYGLLSKKPDNILAKNYAKVTDFYATYLWLIEALLLTTDLLSINLESAFNQNQLIASLILTGSIIYRCWKRPTNLFICGLAWSLEITLSEAIIFWKPSILSLANGNIIFGLITLGLTTWIFRKTNRFANLKTLEILPLFYTTIGLLLHLNPFQFNSYTGLLTLGAAITGIGVGSRHYSWKPIRYLAVIGISIGCYELVIYQMLQASGGSPSDGFTILAIVAATLALIYRVLASFLFFKNKSQLLKFNLAEIKVFAHCHWAIGSILKIFAGALVLESRPQLTIVSIIVSFLLAAYAIIQARESNQTRQNTASDWWVYVGLIEIIATVVYASFIWQQIQLLSPFRVVVTCLVAFIIYQLPWQDWGWRSTPWHRSALTIPGLVILATPNEVSYLSLFAVAIFYGRIAWQQKNIRWSYISLGFLDWALIQFSFEKNFQEILFYNSLIGLSLLYIVQFDPDLIVPSKRKTRHLFRIFASGFICVTALVGYQDRAIIPGIVSLGFILMGLGLQIRAFLFIGTINFLLTAFYQLVVLILDYPFTKWILGLLTGIGLITIAANFERRRDQIVAMLQGWVDQLDRWE